MNELINELSKPEYVNMSDQEAADTVNAKTVNTTVNVENWKIKEHAILNGYWVSIKAGQLDPDPQKAGLCVSVLDWVQDSRIGSTDINSLGVQTMLAGLVAYSLMTQAQANEIVALSHKTVSWTSTVGLPEIGIGLVQNARKEIK